MSKGRRLRVFVDLAPLSPDGGNGGARLFTLDLLAALLGRPGAHEYHLLVKPEAEAAVAQLVSRGAVLERLGKGLDVEEPRRLLRTRRRLHGFFQPLLELAAPDRTSLKWRGADQYKAKAQEAFQKACKNGEKAACDAIKGSDAGE